ncbi:MAG: hypothetical protein V4642_05995 [Bacteroidota bacterium]
MNEMNNYNATPSDLIGLFIDGELGEAERETLFDALSGNVELQLDFERALSIKNAVAQEVLKAVPPVALTNAIFAEAGFGSGVSVVSGVSAVSANSGFLKMLLIPVLSAVLASAITGVVLYEHFEDKLDEIAFKNRVLKESSFAAGTFKNEDSGMAGLTQPFDDKEGFRASRNDNALISSFPQAQRVGNLSSDVSMTRTSDDIRRFRASRNDNRVDVFKSNKKQNFILSKSEESTSEEPRQNVFFIERTENLINESAVLKTEKTELNQLQIPVFKNEEEYQNIFSLQLRGIRNIRLFPKRDVNATGNFFDNTSIGILYHIDNQHFTGIEAGQENFPIYIEDAAGEFQPTSNIQWLGGAYRYTTDKLTFFDNVKPFVHVFAGGSKIGPVFKSISGVVWQPSSYLSFSLGIEGTVLRYRYNGIWKGAEKISATYSISASF